jgi:hypothetical protein
MVLIHYFCIFSVKNQLKISLLDENYDLNGFQLYTLGRPTLEENALTEVSRLYSEKSIETVFIDGKFIILTDLYSGVSTR